ncbi:MAG: polysaccharide pyruvyl transferase family protein [Prevotella sp.]
MSWFVSKARTVWVQLRDVYSYFFRHALVVNGYVDDHTWKGIRHRNWGDDLNYYFLQLITGRPVVFYHNFRLAKWLRFTNYLCIGTLLDANNYANRQTVVWGTGVSGDGRDFVQPRHICSVRGYGTIKCLKEKDFSCPDAVGDAAMLLPAYYRPHKLWNGRKYRLGVIPHVVDRHHAFIDSLESDNILVIDLAHYKCWTDVIDQICSCEHIASSSLHGLIVSDAYAIPNCWIELSGNISGGHFKFYDYFSSVGRRDDKPLVVKTCEDIAEIETQCSQWVAPSIDTGAIIRQCPFPIKRPTYDK